MDLQAAVRMIETERFFHTSSSLFQQEAAGLRTVFSFLLHRAVLRAIPSSSSSWHSELHCGSVNSVIRLRMFTANLKVSLFGFFAGIPFASRHILLPAGGANAHGLHHVVDGTYGTEQISKMIHLDTGQSTDFDGMRYVVSSSLLVAA